MKSTSFYVASKWENRDRVRELARRLETIGHSISHKWFGAEDEYMQNAPLHAMLDFYGVMRCQVFVALFDLKWPFLNAYVEIGMALAWGKPVYIIGEADEACLFTRLEEPHAHIERFDDQESFIAFVAGGGL